MKRSLSEVAAYVQTILLKVFEKLSNEVQQVLANHPTFNSEGQGAAMNVSALVFSPKQDDQ